MGTLEAQQDKESIDQLIANSKRSIELRNTLDRLSKNPDFKEIVQTIYITDGKSILWDNIKTYEELELLEKGSTRTENIQKMKTELQARLILERFFERIRFDAESAELTLEDIDKEILSEDGENDE